MVPKGSVVDPGALNLHTLVDKTVALTGMLAVTLPAAINTLGSPRKPTNTRAINFSFPKEKTALGDECRKYVTVKGSNRLGFKLRC